MGVFINLLCDTRMLLAVLVFSLSTDAQTLVESKVLMEELPAAKTDYGG